MAAGLTGWAAALAAGRAERLGRCGRLSCAHDDVASAMSLAGSWAVGGSLVLGCATAGGPLAFAGFRAQGFRFGAGADVARGRMGRPLSSGDAAAPNGSCVGDGAGLMAACVGAAGSAVAVCSWGAPWAGCGRWTADGLEPPPATGAGAWPAGADTLRSDVGSTVRAVLLFDLVTGVDGHSVDDDEAAPFGGPVLGTSLPGGPDGCRTGMDGEDLPAGALDMGAGEVGGTRAGDRTADPRLGGCGSSSPVFAPRLVVTPAVVKAAAASAVVSAWRCIFTTHTAFGMPSVLGVSHAFSSARSSAMICFISSASSALPWRLTSAHARDAG